MLEIRLWNAWACLLSSTGRHLVWSSSACFLTTCLFVFAVLLLLLL
jgi:hypothetical protein